MTPNVAYAAYMLACVLAAVVVWRVSACDLRGVGRIERRPSEMLDEDAAFATEAERAAAPRRELVHLAPRADLTLLVTLGALFGVLLGAALGWLGPLGLAALGEAEPSSAHPLVADRPMARLAQVVGALALAAAALRLLRAVMLLGALVAAMLALLLATNFVLGRPIWTGLL